MSNDRKFSLFSIWMVLLALGGIVFLLFLPGARKSVVAIVAAIPFLAIGIVGLARSSRVGGCLVIYSDSWSLLWRRKWLPGIFIVFALISFIESAFLFIVTPRPETLRHMGMPTNFIEQLRSALSSSQYIVPDTFTPHIWVGGWILSVILIGVLIWLHGYLKAAPSDAVDTPDARAVRKWIIPLVAVTLVNVAQISVYNLVILFPSGLGRTMAHYLPISQAVSILSILISIFFNGILIGGIAASLDRIKRGDAVSLETFVSDSVRLFKRVAGVYGFLNLVAILPKYILTGAFMFLLRPKSSPQVQDYSLLGPQIWSLIALVFMFAPYAAAKLGLRSWASIKQSVRDWISHAWDVVSFIAVGYSLMIVPIAVLDAAIRAAYGSYIYFFWDFILTLLSALFLPLFAVAVWEFYSRLVSPETTETASSG